MPNITFYLFRHGETDWNKEKQFMGQRDMPLNEVGRKQAMKLAQRIQELSLIELYSSDLLRTRETAELIASKSGIDINYDSRFREIDGGLCTGLRVAEMKAQFPSWWEENQQDSYAARFPEGENFYDVVSRVTEGLEEIANKHTVNQNIGIVTHGGVIISIIAYMLGITQDKRDRLTMDNCGITIISWGGAHPKVLSFNT